MDKGDDRASERDEAREEGSVSACTRRRRSNKGVPGDESYASRGRDGNSDIIRARPRANYGEAEGRAM